MAPPVVAGRKDMVEALLRSPCPRDALDEVFPNLSKVSSTHNVDALSVTSLHVAAFLENVMWILNKDLKPGELISAQTVLRCTRVCSASKLMVPHLTVWLEHFGCLRPGAHGELVAHAKEHLSTNSREFLAGEAARHAVDEAARVLQARAGEVTLTSKGEAAFGTAEGLAEAAADPMNLIIWACQALIVLGNAALLSDEDLPLVEKPQGWSHWRPRAGDAGGDGLGEASPASDESSAGALGGGGPPLPASDDELRERELGRRPRRDDLLCAYALKPLSRRDSGKRPGARKPS